MVSASRLGTSKGIRGARTSAKTAKKSKSDKSTRNTDADGRHLTGAASGGARTKRTRAASYGTAQSTSKARLTTNAAKTKRSPDMTARKSQGTKATTKTKAKAKATEQHTASKIDAVAESNRELRAEVRSIAKMLEKNQGGFSQISGITESLAAVLLQIQRQSRQISGLKKETQGLFTGLDEISGKSDSIMGLEKQVHVLQKRIADVAAAQKSAQQGTDNDGGNARSGIEGAVSTIMANAESIAKLSQAVREMRKDVSIVAARAASAARTDAEIDGLRSEIEKITDMGKPGSVAGMLRGEMEKISQRVESLADTASRVSEIEGALSSIASGSAKIDRISSGLDECRRQISEIVSRIPKDGDDDNDDDDDAAATRLDALASEVMSLAQKVHAAAPMGEDIRAMQSEITALKSRIEEDVGRLGQGMADATGEIHRRGEEAADTYKKIDDIYARIGNVSDSAQKSSQDAMREVEKMLRLSEFQSAIRMNAESKYGDLQAIVAMARETAGICRLFGVGPQEAKGGAEMHDASHHEDDAGGRGHPQMGAGGSPPPDVIRWAVGKMLDCADRWEIRFAEVYAAIKDAIGAAILADTLRLRQVRDIYGIRAVNEIKSDLGIEQP